MKQSIAKEITSWISVFFLCACGPNAGHDDQTTLAPQLNHAYVLIDQGRDSEAIELLNQLQLKGYTQQEVPVALASAYLHRSGVDIIKIYGSVHRMDFNLSARKLALRVKYASVLKSLKDHLRDANLSSSIDQAIDGIAILIMTLDDLQKLPTLNAVQLVDLQKAFDVLSNVPVLTQGNHLYRAVVAVLLFKQFLFQPLPASFNPQSLCQMPVGDAVDLVGNQLPLLVQTIKDVQAAYPHTSSSLADTELSLVSIQNKLGSGELSATLAQVKQYQDEGWLCAP